MWCARQREYFVANIQRIVMFKDNAYAAVWWRPNNCDSRDRGDAELIVDTPDKWKSQPKVERCWCSWCSKKIHKMLAFKSAKKMHLVLFVAVFSATVRFRAMFYVLLGINVPISIYALKAVEMWPHVSLVKNE